VHFLYNKIANIFDNVLYSNF